MSIFMVAAVSLLGGAVGLYLAYRRVRKRVTEEVIDVL